MRLYKYEPDERYQVSIFEKGEPAQIFYVEDTNIEQLTRFVCETLGEMSDGTKTKSPRITVDIRKFSKNEVQKRSRTFYGITVEDAKDYLIAEITNETNEIVEGCLTAKYSTTDKEWKVRKDSRRIASFVAKTDAMLFMSNKSAYIEDNLDEIL